MVQPHQVQGPFCEFEPEQMRTISQCLERLASAIEHQSTLHERADDKFLSAVTDLTKAINELRQDVIPAAIGREQVPLKVFYAAIAVITIASLGVSTIKQIFEIL